MFTPVKLLTKDSYGLPLTWCAIVDVVEYFSTMGLKFAYVNVLNTLFVLCNTTRHLIRVCIRKHQFVL